MSLEIIEQRLIDSKNELVSKILTLHALRGLIDIPIYDENGYKYDLGQSAQTDNQGVEIDHWDGGYEEWYQRGRTFYHCLTVALVTDVLSEAFNLTKSERIELNTAALLHDSDKKRESNWHRAIDFSQSELNETKTGLTGWYYNREKLIKIGEDQNILIQDEPFEIQVTDRLIAAQVQISHDEEWDNLELGIPHEVNMLMRANSPTGKPHQNLKEKIMWFADACVSGTEILPIGERMRIVLDNPRKATQVKQQQAYYRNLYKIEVYYRYQLHLGEKYTNKFAQILGIKPEELIDFISQRVEQRIADNQIPLLQLK